MTEAEMLKKMAGARTPEAAREVKRQAIEWIRDRDPSPAFTSEMEMLNRLASLNLEAMSPQARMATDERRVLCDREGCGFALGLRHVDDSGNWLLALRPGFRREAGDVFGMTEHAIKRHRAGRAPRRAGRSSAWMGNGDDEWPQPCCLPVSVRCPRCSLVQAADPDALQVESFPHPERTHHIDAEWQYDEADLAIVAPVTAIVAPVIRPTTGQRRRSSPRVL